MFGWQGATCIDEWTMAACNLAIGATLMLGGSSAFSLDSALPPASFRDQQRVRLQPLCAGSGRLAGADGGNGDDHIARDQRGGDYRAPWGGQIGATHRQRPYIQRRCPSGIGEKGSTSGRRPVS